MHYFSSEYENLKTGKILHNKSPLLSLTPFMDEHGLIKVGGRIKHTDYSYNKRHPILLLKNSRLTNLIFQEEHIRTLHVGPNLLLSTIRERYWPISGKNTAKQTVKNCVKCFRFTQKLIFLL